MLANIKRNNNTKIWLARIEPLLRLSKKIPNRRWAFIAKLILVIVLAKQLAILTWELIPQDTVKTHWQTANTAVGTQKNTAYSSLSDFHLFGQPPAEAIKPQVAPEHVPATRLAAQLTGVVYSSDQSLSLAIIKASGSDKTYRVGEILKGTRATVHEIYHDRVILLNNDRFESLLMYPDEVNQNLGYTVRPTPPSVKQAIAQARQNPASLSEIVRITPQLVDGQLTGYRINPANKPALFRQLGLKPDDLAIDINGIDLTDQREAIKLIATLPTLKTISLTVEREGKHYKIDIAS